MKLVRKLAFFLALIPFVLFAQDPDPNTNGTEVARMKFQASQVIPPSPEAALLGKYGNVPVSLFTGSPRISIPLTTLQGQHLSLPVSMSYNSSGFKPEEIAPWTGLGWSLNAGGVITRSVQGDPDTDDNYYTITNPLREVPDSALDKAQYFIDIKDKYIETQPDVYYYNFMGHSGKFLIYPDGTITKKEKDYLRITIIVGDSGHPAFSVVDESGIRYEFKATEVSTMVPVDDLPGAPRLVTRTYASSWYLSKVTSPFGNEEIIFEYYSPSEGQSILPPTTIASVTYYRTDLSGTFSLDPDWNLNWNTKTPDVTYNYFYPPSVTVKKKFLKKASLLRNGAIVGYIDFESDADTRDDLGDADFTGERMLRRIKQYNSQNGNDRLFKRFDLSFGYFGNHQSNSPGYTYKRLKLKSIQQISPDSTQVLSLPPYEFAYNGETTDMPERTTAGLDHWGFFNGQSNLYGISQKTLVPTVYSGWPNITGNFGMGANREPSAAYSSLTVLNKIIYPTGGYTTFEYEANSRIGDNGFDTEVGGLRIKNTIDFSFEEQKAVRTSYEYKDTAGLSSAFCASLPTYAEPSIYTKESLCSADFTRYCVTISASPVTGLGSVQGSHIGYKRVTEYKADPATALALGKTVYYYNVVGTSELDDHIGNGDLLKQQTHDSEGHLLEELTNTYHYDYGYPGITIRKLVPLPEQSSKTSLAYNSGTGTWGYIDQSTCGGYGGYSPVLEVKTRYDVLESHVPRESKQLTVQSKKVFDISNGNYILTTRNMTYGNADYNYPTLTEESNSRNEKVFTSIKYAGDYIVSCSPAPGSAAAKIVEMQDANMVAVPVETLVYKQDSAGANTRYVGGKYVESGLGLPQKIYLLKTRPILTSVTPSTASCTLTPSIDANYALEATIAYDAGYNLIEETKADDITTTYLWDYQKRFPVAKITNSLFGSAAYSSFEADSSAGNWSFVRWGCRSDSGSVTGEKAYTLSTSNVTRTGLDTGTTYIVTYWLKNNGGTASVNGAGAGSVLTVRNGWTLYQKEIHGYADVALGGTGVVDELRLYPKNAQMVTYTYEPMVGITSQCDANNRILFYEYDILNRLARVRDQDKNIIKTIEYRYKEAQ